MAKNQGGVRQKGAENQIKIELRYEMLSQIAFDCLDMGAVKAIHMIQEPLAFEICA